MCFSIFEILLQKYCRHQTAFFRAIIHSKLLLGFFILLNAGQPINGQTTISKDSIKYLVENTTQYLNRDINDSRDFHDILKLDKIYHKIPDSPLKADAALNLGRYFESIYSYEISGKHFRNAITLYKKYDKWKEAIDTKKDLVHLYRSNLQIEKIKPILDSCMVICANKRLNESVLIPLMELTIYNSYDTSNYSEAINWGHKFHDTIAHYSALGITDSIFEYRRDLESRIIDIELAKSYIATNTHLDQILPRLNKANAFFTSRNDHSKLSRVNEQYLSYYLKNGEIEKANEHLTKAKIHNDQRKRLEQIRLKELPSYIENATKLENDLGLSHYKNQQLQKLNTLYLASILVVFTLIVLGAIYYVHYSKVKRDLTRKINNIQTQINADLHDNFGSNLAALGTAKNILNDILIKNNYDNNPQLNRFLRIAENRLKDLNEDISDLIWANKDGNNQLNKIIDRIKYLTDKFNKLNNFKVQFSYEFNADFKTPCLWNRQLLLIVKEAIHNSFKHSNSPMMNIKVVSKNEYFSLTCIDYGKGFDLDLLKRKSGLLNMQKRAKSMNCELTITSSNFGTAICLDGLIPRSRTPLQIVRTRRSKPELRPKPQHSVFNNQYDTTSSIEQMQT